MTGSDRDKIDRRVGSGRARHDDGKTWWRAVQKTAKPLKDSRSRRAVSSSDPSDAERTRGFSGNLSAPENPEPQSSETANPHRARLTRTVRPMPTPNTPPVTVDTAPIPLSKRAGIDRRTADRLKRGRLQIDGRLDLHGMTRDSAHSALNAFILSGRAAGKRCILVVTGKGKGILKNEVPRWLNLPPLREQIVAVETAQPQHGGDGALYVLLRRNRDQGGLKGERP